MKRLISVFIIGIFVLFTFSFIGCNIIAKKASTDKNFEKIIDEKLYNIMHPKDNTTAFSSNPYDYIKNPDSRDDYEYIVAQEEKSLNYMLSKFAGSHEDGLEEYIMAIACSEILNQDPGTKKWTTGREWYNEYIEADK